MKILVLQDHLRSGGTERQSVRLAGAFATAGHRVLLLTFRPGGPLEPDPTGPPPFERESLQPFDLGLDWFAPGLRAAARRFAPDIMLCMGRMANCYGGALQRSLPSAAVVATYRTGKTLPSPFRRSLARVRRVVANSAEARSTLAGPYGVDPARVEVIRNALVIPPPPAPGPRDQALRARFGAGPETTVLLCVAMFRPEKNQRELVEIAAGLPPGSDWALWLAGDGPARAHCERLARRRGVAARVRFPGLWPDPSPLYRSADIAVHASSSESLSNFLIEAQAHGVPVVAYEAQGVKECFLPGETGWAIARGARDAFRAELARLIGEAAPNRAERAAKASAFARLSFDPGRQAASYLALFSSLLPGTDAAGRPRSRR